MCIKKTSKKYYYDKSTGLLVRKKSKTKNISKKGYCASSVILPENR